MVLSAASLAIRLNLRWHLRMLGKWVVPHRL